MHELTLLSVGIFAVMELKRPGCINPNDFGDGFVDLSIFHSYASRRMLSSTKWSHTGVVLMTRVCQDDTSAFKGGARLVFWSQVVLAMLGLP